MPTIDPKWRVLIGIVSTIAIGVSSGALVLTNAIPADWIKPVTAWCGIIAFVGSAVQTTVSALGMTTQSRVDAAAADPKVQKVVVLKEIADATPSNKVVSQ